MKENDNQALIEHAKLWIANAEAARDEIPFGFDEDAEKELSLVKIALATLTEQPVKDGSEDFESLIMLISRGLADVEKGLNGYHDPQIQVFWENYQVSKGIVDEVQE